MLHKTYFRTMFFAAILLYASQAHAQGSHDGGPTPVTSTCMSLSERHAIEAQLQAIRFAKPAAPNITTMFYDPMGGGTNSFGQSIVNYVDLDPSSGLLDFACKKITYDGHRGTDVEVVDFYRMDEGVPILAAAPGLVTFTRDGEFDRQTSWLSGTRANTVIIRHEDGSEAWYLHMRKNSVSVAEGVSVAVGDTMGYIGSSGFSSGPHLHFEIRHAGQTVDPFNGSCQSNASRWVNQGPHVFDLPFELMQHGLSTIPISWAEILERPPSKTHVTGGSRIYSWIRVRNVSETDNLNWQFFANGALWNSYSFHPSGTFSSSYWFINWNLPNDPNLFGNWILKIFRNGVPIAEQPFVYDNSANQLPTIETTRIPLAQDGAADGEFVANDPDGSVYWYKIARAPKHGTLTHFGARKRRFIYIPNHGFTGMDTVQVFAVDDEDSAGPAGMYIFEVGTSVAVEEISNSVPAEFSLSQNYPNPFNPSTTIRFNLPEPGLVALTIYDLHGREVETLLSGWWFAGRYQVEWKPKDMASGIYLYRLQSEGFSKTMKLVLQK